jgi:hypothetical protein
MCLTVSRNSRIRIATKDIVAYKFVFKSNILKDTYVSSFRYYPCPLNTLCETNLGRKQNNYGYYIELGFHTLKSRKAANKYACKYMETVIKATIPKGSRYWWGRFEKDISYCSEQIIYSEL